MSTRTGTVQTDSPVSAASGGSLTDVDRAPLLPPGPPLPRSIQGVGFGLARRRVLQRLQARYGDAVTVHLPIYGRAV
ncbi:MAG: cytochrome P450, partial [Dietzia sp.]|nr:cytochrome P450 [Dietzia sp.]